MPPGRRADRRVGAGRAAVHKAELNRGVKPRGGLRRANSGRHDTVACEACRRASVVSSRVGRAASSRGIVAAAASVAMGTTPHRLGGSGGERWPREAKRRAALAAPHRQADDRGHLLPGLVPLGGVGVAQRLLLLRGPDEVARPKGLLQLLLTHGCNKRAVRLAELLGELGGLLAWARGDEERRRIKERHNVLGESVHRVDDRDMADAL